MMPPMTTRLAVGDAVDVDLDGVLEELVDQDGRALGVLERLERLAHVARESAGVCTISIARPPST